MCIGIVDITTVGATICQREIAEQGGKEGDHREFIVHSLPFCHYRQAVLARDWQQLAKLILISIDKLAKAGADFIIIPSNTPHYAFAEFSAASPLPILNLIDITAAECARRKLKRVAVLGTKATMTQGLYLTPLKKQGIIPVVPAETVCNQIDDFIMNELIPETVTESSRDQVATSIKNLACDGVILGCTELPDTYSETDLGIPAIDTTRLLAQQAVIYDKQNFS